MYPSLETWTLTDLENRLGLLNGVAVTVVIAVTLIGLFGGLWWDGYKDRINAQIEKMKSEEREKKDAAIKADVDEAKKLIPETTGVITPGNGECPPIPKREARPIPAGLPERARKAFEEMNAPFPDNAFLFFLGNNVCWTPDFPLCVVTQGDEDIVWIEKEGDGITLSAKFFNKEGKIICEIVKNTFHMNWKNYFRIERPPHRLTVIDDELRRIIDIEYINKRCIRLFGNFNGRAGVSIEITPEHTKAGNFLMAGGRATLKGGDKRTLLAIPGPDGSGTAAIGVVESKPKPANVTVGAPALKTFAAGDPVTISLPLSNSAEGRAGVEQMRFNLVISDVADLPNEMIERFKSGTNVTSIRLAIAGYGTGEIHNTFSDAKMDASHIDAINKGELTLFLLGELHYADMITKSKRVWFSFVYDPKDKTFRPTGNYQGSE